MGKEKMVEKLAEKLIDAVEWRIAKTMPEIPHEYIVIDWYPDKKEEINAFVELINKNGYTKKFYSKEYKYLKIGNYKYWVIENIINRAKIEE